MATLMMFDDMLGLPEAFESMFDTPPFLGPGPFSRKATARSRSSQRAARCPSFSFRCGGAGGGAASCLQPSRLGTFEKALLDSLTGGSELLVGKMAACAPTTTTTVTTRGGLNNLYHSAKPRMEDTDDAFLAHIPTPGVPRTDIDVELHEGRVLVVKAGRDNVQEEKDTEGRVIRRRRTQRASEFAFTLPEDADEANLSAEYRDGMLTLKVPKVAPVPAIEPRKVPVIQAPAPPSLVSPLSKAPPLVDGPTVAVPPPPPPAVEAQPSSPTLAPAPSPRVSGEENNKKMEKDEGLVEDDDDEWEGVEKEPKKDV